MANKIYKALFVKVKTHLMVAVNAKKAGQSIYEYLANLVTDFNQDYLRVKITSDRLKAQTDRVKGRQLIEKDMKKIKSLGQIK